MNHPAAARQTQTVAVARATKGAKPVYKPYVTKESASTYTVNSETYTYPLYTIAVVDGRAVSCECAGNHVWGKVCKHMRAVQYNLDYHQHPSHIRPIAVEEAAPVLPAPINISSRRKSAAFIPAPEALAELFS